MSGNVKSIFNPFFSNFSVSSIDLSKLGKNKAKSINKNLTNNNKAKGGADKINDNKIQSDKTYKSIKRNTFTEQLLNMTTRQGTRGKNKKIQIFNTPEPIGTITYIHVYPEDLKFVKKPLSKNTKLVILKNKIDKYAFTTWFKDFDTVKFKKSLELKANSVYNIKDTNIINLYEPSLEEKDKKTNDILKKINLDLTKIIMKNSSFALRQKKINNSFTSVSDLMPFDMQSYSSYNKEYNLTRSNLLELDKDSYKYVNYFKSNYKLSREYNKETQEINNIVERHNSLKNLYSNLALSTPFHLRGEKEALKSVKNNSTLSILNKLSLKYKKVSKNYFLDLYLKNDLLAKVDIFKSNNINKKLQYNFFSNRILNHTYIYKFEKNSYNEDNSKSIILNLLPDQFKEFFKNYSYIFNYSAKNNNSHYTLDLIKENGVGPEGEREKEYNNSKLLQFLPLKYFINYKFNYFYPLINKFENHLLDSKNKKNNLKNLGLSKLSHAKGDKNKKYTRYFYYKSNYNLISHNHYKENIYGIQIEEVIKLFRNRYDYLNFLYNINMIRNKLDNKLHVDRENNRVRLLGKNNNGGNIENYTRNNLSILNSKSIFKLLILFSKNRVSILNLLKLSKVLRSAIDHIQFKNDKNSIIKKRLIPIHSGNLITDFNPFRLSELDTMYPFTENNHIDKINYSGITTDVNNKIVNIEALLNNDANYKLKLIYLVKLLNSLKKMINYNFVLKSHAQRNRFIKSNNLVRPIFSRASYRYKNKLIFNIFNIINLPIWTSKLPIFNYIINTLLKSNSLPLTTTKLSDNELKIENIINTTNYRDFKKVFNSRLRGNINKDYILSMQNNIFTDLYNIYNNSDYFNTLMFFNYFFKEIRVFIIKFKPLLHNKFIYEIISNNYNILNKLQNLNKFKNSNDKFNHSLLANHNFNKDLYNNILYKKNFTNIIIKYLNFNLNANINSFNYNKVQDFKSIGAEQEKDKNYSVNINSIKSINKNYINYYNLLNNHNRNVIIYLLNLTMTQYLPIFSKIYNKGNYSAPSIDYIRTKNVSHENILPIINITNPLHEKTYSNYLINKNLLLIKNNISSNLLFNRFSMYIDKIDINFNKYCNNMLHNNKILSLQGLQKNNYSSNLNLFNSSLQLSKPLGETVSKWNNYNKVSLRHNRSEDIKNYNKKNVNLLNRNLYKLNTIHNLKSMFINFINYDINFSYNSTNTLNLHRLNDININSTNPITSIVENKEGYINQSLPLINTKPTDKIEYNSYIIKKISSHSLTSPLLVNNESLNKKLHVLIKSGKIYNLRNILKFYFNNISTLFSLSHFKLKLKSLQKLVNFLEVSQIKTTQKINNKKSVLAASKGRDSKNKKNNLKRIFIPRMINNPLVKIKEIKKYKSIISLVSREKINELENNKLQNLNKLTSLGNLTNSSNMVYGPYPVSALAILDNTSNIIEKGVVKGKEVEKKNKNYLSKSNNKSNKLLLSSYELNNSNLAPVSLVVAEQNKIKDNITNNSNNILNKKIEIINNKNFSLSLRARAKIENKILNPVKRIWRIYSKVQIIKLINNHNFNTNLPVKLPFPWTPLNPLTNFKGKIWRPGDNASEKINSRNNIGTKPKLKWNIKINQKELRKIIKFINFTDTNFKANFNKVFKINLNKKYLIIRKAILQYKLYLLSLLRKPIDTNTKLINIKFDKLFNVKPSLGLYASTTSLNKKINGIINPLPFQIDQPHHLETLKAEKVISSPLSYSLQIKDNSIYNSVLKLKNKEKNKTAIVDMHSNKLGIRKLFLNYNHNKEMRLLGNYQIVNFNPIKNLNRMNTLTSMDYTGSMLNVNTSLILKYFFKLIGKSIISKPVYTFKPNKLIIRLSYFLNQKTYFFNENEKNNLLYLMMINLKDDKAKLSNLLDNVPKWIFLKRKNFKYNYSLHSRYKFFQIYNLLKLRLNIWKKISNSKFNYIEYRIRTIKKLKELNKKLGLNNILIKGSFNSFQDNLVSSYFTNFKDSFKSSAILGDMQRKGTIKNINYFLSPSIPLPITMSSESNMIKGNLINSNLIKEYNNKYNSNQLALLEKNNTLHIFYNEFNALTYLLECYYNCPVQLEFTRLYYPFYDSNILSQIIGLNGKKHKLIKILKLLQKKWIIRNPKKSLIKFDLKPNKKNNIFSYLSGVKLRVAGRFHKNKIVPKKTVYNKQFGSMARCNVNFVESSRYINKSKRGSFSVTVSVSHIF